MSAALGWLPSQLLLITVANMNSIGTIACNSEVPARLCAGRVELQIHMMLTQQHSLQSDIAYKSN